MAQDLDPQAWAEELVTSIVRWGIEGAPLPNPIGGEPLRFKSAAQLAQEYRQRADQVGLPQAIEELIEDQARWNAGTGFVTGIGGFAFLPVQLPAAVTATWVIQTRLVAAIADLYGFSLEQIGVKASQQFAQAQIRRLPAAALAAINRAVGFRLVSKFGQEGVVNLHKAIPLLGGLVGGGIDYMMTRKLGDYAAAELGRRVPRSADASEVIDVEVIG
jgi:uncharacterized protein (DUF697 family)